MIDAISTVKEVQAKLIDLSGEKGKTIKVKTEAVFIKIQGYQTLIKISNIMSGGEDNMAEDLS